MNGSPSAPGRAFYLLVALGEAACKETKAGELEEVEEVLNRVWPVAHPAIVHGQGHGFPRPSGAGRAGNRWNRVRGYVTSAPATVAGRLRDRRGGGRGAKSKSLSNGSEAEMTKKMSETLTRLELVKVGLMSGNPEMSELDALRTITSGALTNEDALAKLGAEHLDGYKRTRSGKRTRLRQRAVLRLRRLRWRHRLIARRS